MKLHTLIMLCLMSVVPPGYATDKKASSGLPPDVVNFMERRDLCDHFRGEDPYNEERRKFLEENLKKYCTGTDKELASLKAKHNNNEAVLKALANYEERIEGGN